MRQRGDRHRGRCGRARVGPSAGFLFGFLPGVVVIALLRGKSDTSSFAAAARTAGRTWEAALALANRVAGGVCQVAGGTLTDEEFARLRVSL